MQLAVKKLLAAQNIILKKIYSIIDTEAEQLYRSMVRSKLDFGCIIYGSAHESYLQALDRVQNAAIRVCLGAFRFSPISSLHLEANELPLQLKRQKLALQYVIKLKCIPNNPALASVCQPNFKPLFEAKPHAIPALGLHIHESLTETGIDLNYIAKWSTSYSGVGSGNPGTAHLS